jgi:tetratricopeptide (TPR) repeat protein
MNRELRNHPVYQKLTQVFSSRFAVQIILGALLCYGLTLSHGVTVASLSLTAKLAGWDARSMNDHPLLWLTTLPLRVLPAGWIAPALNLYSAALAAMILGILAQTLELAAWVRPLETLGWRGRLPVLLACVLCGLEYNYWSEAIAATGEMLQILLLAAAILCLLKYRDDRRFRWMLAASLIWGLGLAENWMMVFTLPLFVFSLLWLGWRRFLAPRRLLQVVALGLAGFSIFFLMPLVNSLKVHEPLKCIEFCMLALKDYGEGLKNIFFLFWKAHPTELFVTALYFMIPVMSVFLRPLDNKKQHLYQFEQIMLWSNRAARMLILLACVWLAFDPAIGPRQILKNETGLALPLLSLDYLLALAAGFLAGNLMLALLPDFTQLRRRPHRRFLERFARHGATPAFTGLLALATLGLLFRNTPAILLVNRQPLTQLANLAMRRLPPGGGLMLSDEPTLLMAFQSASGGSWLAVNTLLLPLPEYRQQLSRSFPGDWLTKPGQGDLTPQGVNALVGQFAQSNQVYYLQDNCGSLFETFYLEPAGPVFALQRMPDKAIDPPPPSETALAATEKFWDDITAQCDDIRETIYPRQSLLVRKLMHVLARAQIRPVSPAQSQMLAISYSVALNDWGVRLQRAGQLAAAQKRFTQALELNTNNAAAKMNLVCNSNLVAGIRLDIDGVKSLADQVGDSHHLSQFIHEYGMVDAPSFCYLLGTTFLDLGMPRQSMQQFERACELAPDVVTPKLALAQLYTRYGFAEKARQLIAEIRGQAASPAQKNSLEAELSVLEAQTWFSQTNYANASATLQALLQEHPGDLQVQELAVHAYMSFGEYSNALPIVNARLAVDSDNVGALLDQAAIYEQLGKTTNSVVILNRVLSITNSLDIRLMRDNAYRREGQLDLAEKDYLALDQIVTNHLATDYALAQTALLRNNTNDAILWLQLCLAEVPSNSEPYQILYSHLTALKSGKANPVVPLPGGAE